MYVPVFTVFTNKKKSFVPIRVYSCSLVVHEWGLVQELFFGNKNRIRRVAQTAASFAKVCLR